MQERFITKLDIFGQGVQLTLNQQEKSKTVLGGILTVVLMILLLSMFFITSLEVFYRKNPIIAIEDRILTEHPNITLSKDTFPFSFSFINNTSYNIYKPRYFTYEAVHVHGDISQNLGEDRLNLTLCKIEYFPNMNEDDFYNTGSNYNFCVENQNITIGGSWGESYISFISIRLSICQNKTGECAPIEEILDYMSQTNYYINVYFINRAINSQNDTNPISYYYTSVYKSMAVDKYKYVDLWIKKNDLISDDGFLFSSDNTYNSLSLDRTEFDITQLAEPGLLLEFRFYSSNRQQVVHRRYTKIQTVLAGVGGMANILRIFFIIVCYVFSKIKRDEMILNQIFDFDLIEKKSIIQKSRLNIHKPTAQTVHSGKNTDIAKLLLKEISSKKNLHVDAHVNSESRAELIKPEENVRKEKKRGSLINDKIDGLFGTQMNNPFKPTNFHSHVNLIPPRMRLQQADDNQQNESFHLENLTPEDNEKAKKIIESMENRKKNYRLHFSFCEVFNWFFCFCCIGEVLRHKKKLYHKTIASVRRFIDITYVIQKLEEFEKLKFVLFNAQQLAMFNFISKDFCSLNTKDTSVNPIHQMKKFNNNREILAKFVLSFKTQCEEPNTVDLKLFNLLNDDIKINFESGFFKKVSQQVGKVIVDS